MARDLSIAISAKDNFTSAITTMKNASQSFSKDLSGLKQYLDQLNKNKYSLKFDMEKAKKDLSEAEKEFKKTGEAVDDLNQKRLDYENICQNFRMVSREAKQTEKDILSLTGAISKADNRAGSAKKGTGESSLLKKLAGAGLTKMLGDSVAGMLSAGISSAFGADTGSAISTTLSGAINGAAMGMAFGPIGAAVGAGAGLLAGGISATSQQFQREDEAFKSYVQGSVQEQLNRQASDLQAGSAIAADRETSLISFTTLFDNDEDRAKAYFDELKDMANNTPFLFDDLKDMSKVLKSYGYTDEEGSDFNLIDTMTAIGDTGAALGMSTADMGEVAKAMGRMNSSNKTTLEYLNPLLERGIPVMDYLSEGFGIAKDKIYDAVSKGLIPGQEAALCIKTYMEDAKIGFGGSMERMSKTFPGLQSTLQGWEQEMQNAIGEGYNEERKKGIQSQIDYLSGEDGERMKDANRMLGAWKADLENEREEILRRHEREALDRIKREGLDEVEGGRLLAEARINAQAEYNASEGAQLELESQKQLIASTREKLVQDRDYWDAGYELGQEFTKGMAAATRDEVPYILGIDAPDRHNGTTTGSWGLGTGMLGASIDIKNGVEAIQGIASRFTKAAVGIDRVPYDNFPVLLHQGERVLTAQEARSNKQAPQITIRVDGLTVREEADVDKIARKLADELHRHQLVAINV